jgi:hypothetical protein
VRYYLDTEFDGFGGDLISLALVREDGASLYRILKFSADDEWVLKNVVPILDSCPVRAGPAISHAALAGAIEDFLTGDPNPVIVADWPDDVAYFSKALITGPGTMIAIPRVTFEVRRVDAYPTTLHGAVQHNAWWDAMALRHKLQAQG